MLTDAALRALKPKEKDYKVADRDGMYVHVTTKGAMSFRMDYRLNGRRESLYLGRYAPDGLSVTFSDKWRDFFSAMWRRSPTRCVRPRPRRR